MGGFAGGRRDYPGREGVISIRDMGVEGNARFVAAARVDVADCGATAPGMELLSVARRGGAVSPQRGERHGAMGVDQPSQRRSEENTSELQSLMRISYPVICLKTKTKNIITIQHPK